MNTLTISVTLGSAPLSINKYCTIAVCPLIDAAIRGVLSHYIKKTGSYTKDTNTTHTVKCHIMLYSLF